VPNTVWEHLTPKEQALLRAIGKGLNYKQIAKEFRLAEQTVRTYASDLYQKLVFQSRAQAVMWLQARDKMRR
jgi:NarL family two-component system response regulator LiaR